MKKCILSVLALILILFIFPSCIYYVDRPYGYFDDESGTNVYSYDADNQQSYAYQNDASNYCILRIYDNRYVFYDDDTEIAVWIFQPGGIIIRRGRAINGWVKLFYGYNMPAAEMMYTNNIRDGLCRYYYRNGKPMGFGEYRNGVRAGDWKRFNESGMVDEEFTVSGGKTAYKVKSALPDNKALPGEFEYLNRENGYKKEIIQDFDAKDIYPKKINKKFGENPFEKEGKNAAVPGAAAPAREVKAEVNQNEQEKQKPENSVNRAAGNESGKVKAINAAGEKNMRGNENAARESRPINKGDNNVDNRGGNYEAPGRENGRNRDRN